MFDPRAIANTILDVADERGIDCSNLQLQKLLYFVHGKWLVKYNVPLCTGHFEAWQHGPVHPLVYDAFSSCGASKIVIRAESMNPVTRQKSEIFSVNDIDVLDVIRLVVGALGHLSGSQLRNITHAKESPWSIIDTRSSESANIGMKIPNELITTNFGRQLYLLGNGPEEGNLNENAPYS